MRDRRRERGTALVWALLLLFLAASLSAALLDRGRAVDGAAKADAMALRRHYALEGARALARARLARDPAYKGGRVRVDDHEIDVRVITDQQLICAVVVTD